MTDDNRRTEREEAAARAGYATGQALRWVISVFGFALGGLVIGGNLAGDRWRTAIVIASLVVGGLGVAGAVVRNPFLAALGAYMLLVAAGSVVHSVEPRPTAAVVAISAGTILSALAFMVLTIRRGRRSRELERMLFAESTSVAFFVTMIGAITYALLEAWLDAPKLSMWIVWTIGMVTWGLGSFVLGRRYS